MKIIIISKKLCEFLWNRREGVKACSELSGTLTHSSVSLLLSAHLGHSHLHEDWLSFTSLHSYQVYIFLLQQLIPK